MNIEYYEKKALVNDLVEKYFDVEKYLKACKECKYYDKNHSCPSYNFDTIKYINQYKNIILVLAKIKLVEDERVFETYNNLLDSVKIRIREHLEKMENRKERSRFLNVGPCKLCDVCNRVNGKSCRHPDKRRFSIQSLGGNVVGIVKDYFNEEILWEKDGIVPSYFTFLGGLLYN